MCWRRTNEQTDRVLRSIILYGTHMQHFIPECPSARKGQSCYVRKYFLPTPTTRPPPTSLPTVFALKQLSPENGGRSTFASLLFGVLFATHIKALAFDALTNVVVVVSSSFSYRTRCFARFDEHMIEHRPPQLSTRHHTKHRWPPHYLCFAFTPDIGLTFGVKASVALELRRQSLVQLHFPLDHHSDHLVLCFFTRCVFAQFYRFLLHTVLYCCVWGRIFCVVFTTHSICCGFHWFRWRLCLFTKEPLN